MLINGQPHVIHLDERTFHCALDVTMHYIGGKWKTVILWYLRKEPKRFSALKQHIPDITEKMLSLQLKQLEKDGFVHREVFPEVPPRVEYSLTEWGRRIMPLVEAMAAWGREVTAERGSVSSR